MLHRSPQQIAAFLVSVAVAAPACAVGTQKADAPARQSSAPIVIGHRGASGYRPEHTLASYELAVDLGADFIEPDLVSTLDGQLVARHENEISGTTDVASHPEFAARRTTKTIDGVALTGWFTEDFTLAELKTLRAVERIPSVRQENTLYNGRFEIPTLQEVIDLAKRKTREKGRVIGVYIETKHPTYFDSIGKSLEEPLIAILQANKLDGRLAPVYVQSFEVANLKQINQLIDVKLVQLLSDSGKPYDFVVSGDKRGYTDLVTPAGLAEVATYANGIGPSKTMILPRDASGASLPPTSLVTNAHAAGLVLHPYTFRNENQFLPLELRVGATTDTGYASNYGKAIDEYKLFYNLGVDGWFADNPDTAVEARKELLGL